MAIIIANNSGEKYSKLARVVEEAESDLLNGRNDKGITTTLRGNKLKNLIDRYCKKDGIIVDVGCGDCEILLMIADNCSEAVGVIPTAAEYEFVSNLRKNSVIDLIQGSTTNIPLKNQSSDTVLCNGVLHGTGFTKHLFDQSLKEFSRILRPNGHLVLGEFPNSDEFEGRNYGTSVILFFLHLISTYNFRKIKKELLAYVAGVFTKRHYIVNNTNGFFLKSEDVESRAKLFGFKLICCNASLEKTKRFDYIFRKIK